MPLGPNPFVTNPFQVTTFGGGPTAPTRTPSGLPSMGNAIQHPVFYTPDGQPVINGVVQGQLPTTTPVGQIPQSAQNPTASSGPRQPFFGANPNNTFGSRPVRPVQPNSSGASNPSANPLFKTGPNAINVTSQLPDPNASWNFGPNPYQNNPANNATNPLIKEEQAPWGVSIPDSIKDILSGNKSGDLGAPAQAQFSGYAGAPSVNWADMYMLGNLR